MTSCLGHQLDTVSGPVPLPDTTRTAQKTKALAKTPTLAVMASCPGREDLLTQALESLRDQVDEIALYWGGGQAPGDAYRYIDVLEIDPSDRYGSAGKLAWLLGGFRGVYLTVDDDIAYPVDYVAEMCRGLAEYGGRALVMAHGSVLHEPRYETGVHYRGLGAVPEPGVWVNHPGTCALALDTRVYQPDVPLWPDLEETALAVWGQRSQVPMRVLPHPKGWLTNLDRRPANRPTIWKRTRGDNFRARNAALARFPGPWRVYDADPAA